MYTTFVPALQLIIAGTSFHKCVLLVPILLVENAVVSHFIPYNATAKLNTNDPNGTYNLSQNTQTRILESRHDASASRQHLPTSSQ
jgi:hypothetical protein